MAVPDSGPQGTTDVPPGYEVIHLDPKAQPECELDFDVIKRRAGEILNIPAERVTDVSLGQLFGTARETVGRLKRGDNMASLTTAMDISAALDLPVNAFVRRNVNAGERA